MQIDFYLTTTNIPIFFNIDLGELHQKKKITNPILNSK